MMKISKNNKLIDNTSLTVGIKSIGWQRLKSTLALVIVTTVLSLAQQTTGTFPLVSLSLSLCVGYVFGVGSASAPCPGLASTSCARVQARPLHRVQAPCFCVASKLTPSPLWMLLGQAPVGERV
jgi:hypothetical protein